MGRKLTQVQAVKLAGQRFGGALAKLGVKPRYLLESAAGDFIAELDAETELEAYKEAVDYLGGSEAFVVDRSEG